MAGLIVSLAAFGGSAGLSIIPASPVEITIEAPSFGAVVPGQETETSGTVYPPDSRVLVLVHPVDSNRWWVQEPAVISQQQEGPARWEARIQLGTESLGIGEAFQVVAVASQDPLWFDLLTGRCYQTGDEVYSLPPLSWSNLLVLYRSNAE